MTKYDVPWRLISSYGVIQNSIFLVQNSIFLVHHSLFLVHDVKKFGTDLIISGTRTNYDVNIYLVQFELSPFEDRSPLLNTESMSLPQLGPLPLLIEGEVASVGGRCCARTQQF